jgi:hypothetical protein
MSHGSRSAAIPAELLGADRTGIELRTAHVDLGAVSGIRHSRRCGSQNGEPTCSGAPGRSTTQPDSSRRSVAPPSTQSGGHRHSEVPRISLTRKRSLVQIQYGPRFSNVCLAVSPKREPAGSQEQKELISPIAEMSFSDGDGRSCRERGRVQTVPSVRRLRR